MSAFHQRAAGCLRRFRPAPFSCARQLAGLAFDERVMAAMGRVPRHEFVPLEFQPFAYANIPLPIGFDKTISQPFIVALMTDLTC
jgi:protein-L-isoaspartate O-methyltransferase